MGILYGISTGPGDPALMTVKAVRILQQCSTVAAPQKPGTGSLALRIASEAADLTEKRLLPLDLPMTKEPAVLRAAVQNAADRLCEALQTGDTAFLCLGDLSLYATYQPIAALVRERGFQTVQIPGVMSCSAAAAATGKALASGEEPLQILPFGCRDFESRLQLPGGKVILKCGAHLPELYRILERTGLLSRACAVENCGLPGERILSKLQPDMTAGYFTAVLIEAEE